MKGSTRIAKIDGKLFVIVDGTAIKKPVSRVVIDAEDGEDTKLIIEIELDETEVVSPYDTVRTELSIKAKATLCLEVLSYLQPEDLEELIGNVNGNFSSGYMSELMSLIKKRFIGGGEEDVNEDRPGPDVRDERFWTLAG